MQAQHSRAAAGSGGGDVLGWGHRRRHRLSYLLSRRRLSLPPITGGLRGRAPQAGYWARLPTLIATLASLERKSVLLQIVGAVSLPDIEAANRRTYPPCWSSAHLSGPTCGASASGCKTLTLPQGLSD